LMPQVSYRNFGAIFSDIWTLNSTELNHLASQGLFTSELPRACQKSTVPNKECGTIFGNSFPWYFIITNLFQVMSSYN
jgi:hypothetical protein